MPFTPAQLAAQMQNPHPFPPPNLATWSASTLANQAPMLAAYFAYWDGVQNWITLNGGNGAPFGWDNLIGLEKNGQQVVLLGPQQTAPFNDAFNDVRTHRGSPGFRLFQASQAAERLIRFLPNL
ncbi:hypothetical protein SAMN02745244_01061 [Tessaracoccus bendigoensis DSM 12906]|uniref:Uncharacterized protein n=2 Tax=Tessaracoccus TaxID=72763 RepID=A0A1M6E0Y1_9ACTN|nr:hypothetical protein SAMN02745244_01061 [Tessaracoccus bendigoensis DSM 12906]